MQNSELYRRGFVVPLDEVTETSLMNNDVTKNALVNFFEIPGSEIFESLLSKGLFEQINSQLDTMLDDFEEERFEQAKIPLLKRIVEEFKDQNELNEDEMKIINTLSELCDLALDKNTSLFIIL